MDELDGSFGEKSQEIERQKELSKTHRTPIITIPPTAWYCI